MTLPQTPSFHLTGKRALVTGGSRGLGFACAVALAQAGAEVWIAARDRHTLEHAAALAAEGGLTLHSMALDITDISRIDAVLAELPAFDILVNSAGLARHEPFLAVSETHFDAVMTLNVYCASKFALEGLSKTMALELGGAGIRVNTLCPTFIETELSRQSLDDPDFRRYVLENIKLRRLGRVEDVMGPVVFLASDAAAMITGTALLVDGGWTAT